MVGFGLLLTQVEEAEKHSVTEEETDANNNQVEEQKDSLLCFLSPSPLEYNSRDPKASLSSILRVT